jgi:hypothetical protein
VVPDIFVFFEKVLNGDLFSSYLEEVLILAYQATVKPTIALYFLPTRV